MHFTTIFVTALMALGASAQICRGLGSKCAASYLRYIFSPFSPPSNAMDPGLLTDFAKRLLRWSGRPVVLCYAELVLQGRCERAWMLPYLRVCEQTSRTVSYRIPHTDLA